MDEEVGPAAFFRQAHVVEKFDGGLETEHAVTDQGVDPSLILLPFGTASRHLQLDAAGVATVAQGTKQGFLVLFPGQPPDADQDEGRRGFVFRIDMGKFVENQSVGNGVQPGAEVQAREPFANVFGRALDVGAQVVYGIPPKADNQVSQPGATVHADGGEDVFGMHVIGGRTGFAGLARHAGCIHLEIKRFFQMDDIGPVDGCFDDFPVVPGKAIALRLGHEIK